MGGFRFKEDLNGEFINMKTAEKIVSEVVEAVKEWREIAIRQCGRGVLSFRECRTVC